MFSFLCWAIRRIQPRFCPGVVSLSLLLQAVGTSLLSNAVTCIFGASSYYASDPQLILEPLAVIVCLAASIGTRLGARLSLNVSARRLQLVGGLGLFAFSPLIAYKSFLQEINKRKPSTPATPLDATTSDATTQNAIADHLTTSTLLSSSSSSWPSFSFLALLLPALPSLWTPSAFDPNSGTFSYSFSFSSTHAATITTEQETRTATTIVDASAPLVSSPPSFLPLSLSFSLPLSLERAIGVGGLIGMTSGFLGMGAGLLFTTYFLLSSSLPYQQVAATSLAAFALPHLLGAATHHTAGNIITRALPALLSGSFVGAKTGSIFGLKAQEDTLRTVLCVFLLLAGLRQIHVVRSAAKNLNAKRK